MGQCFCRRDQNSEVSSQQNEQIKEDKSNANIQVKDNKQIEMETSQPKNQENPSISFDECENENSDSPMNLYDDQFLQKRQLYLKNKPKPKICKKNVIRHYSPKRDQKLNLDDYQPSFSSQKCLDGIKISKNKLLHQKYQLINRNRMKNRVINHLQNQIQESQQDNQIINQMILEPYREQEEVIQYSRKSSERESSNLLEIDAICFSCQTNIQNNIYQLECLHHYHQNCISELIIQQINDNKVQIYCRCNKVISTKLLAFILREQDDTDHQLQHSKMMDIYFKNQHDYLTQNLF